MAEDVTEQAIKYQDNEEKENNEETVFIGICTNVCSNRCDSIIDLRNNRFKERKNNNAVHAVNMRSFCRY